VAAATVGLASDVDHGNVIHDVGIGNHVGLHAVDGKDDQGARRHAKTAHHHCSHTDLVRHFRNLQCSPSVSSIGADKIKIGKARPGSDTHIGKKSGSTHPLGSSVDRDGAYDASVLLHSSR
jgi:hypothetical protein